MNVTQPKAKAAKKTKPAEEVVAPEPTEIVVSYKGFDKDWKCRGMQYAVGQTFEHKGEVAACSGGLHACEDPLHVFRYYRPASSVFAVVEQSGTLSRHDEDSKVASSRLTVKAELSIAGIIKAAIEYRLKKCKPSGGAVATERNESATASGDSGAATASGYSGAATASGYYGAATASGYSGAATASGNSGAATASGNYGAATASGNYGAATASGNSGAATASGNSGAATASGNSGAATASGNYGAATASGNSGAATASGDSGAATASGYYGAATADNAKAIACAPGRNGKAKGIAGAALFLTYRDDEWNIVHAKAAIVGRDGIEADVFYRLDSAGNFVKA
jgi:hypothetical protein